MSDNVTASDLIQDKNVITCVEYLKQQHPKRPELLLRSKSLVLFERRLADVMTYGEFSKVPALDIEVASEMLQLAKCNLSVLRIAMTILFRTK